MAATLHRALSLQGGVKGLGSDLIQTDVAVVGGSLGGVAAALAALAGGARTVLTESTDWLGGQLTSQGVSAPDEHPLIERFGGTARYSELRARVRRHYRDRYGAPATMPDGLPLNPGNGWVSRLCFEPRVGVAVIGEMLEPFLTSGQLTVLYHHTPVAATVTGSSLRSVTLRHQAEHIRLAAAFFLDATDLGDLLPLCGAPFVTGAEARSDTGEPHAPPEANPNEMQALTYGFAVEFRPGESHTIPKPEGYERFRDAGLYTLTLEGGKRFRMFELGDDGALPFWTYRRLLDARLLNLPHDVALINWASNDYFWRGPFDNEAQAEAKAQALGFLYWLQTEAPRDDAHDNSGTGYPELKLRADVMGTPDGLSKAPYIREGRRVAACKRVSERDISAACRAGARAAPFDDAVGVGWYPIDLHRCVGNPEVALFEPTRPFQIPLGSLLPLRPDNLLAAGKNIGTTHLSGGAYRLHPVEWAVGEAAGSLAAHLLGEGCAPRVVYENRSRLRRFQLRLLEHGVPIAWTTDVPPGHPLFVPAQLLVVAGGIDPESGRAGRLELDLEVPLNPAERLALSHAAEGLLTDLGVSPAPPETQTWADTCRWLLTRLY